MGGGASSMQGVDELLSATYMIGRAISAITFPGMYRIYDFHSSKAPKLKNQRQFTFFAPDSDDEDESLLERPDESTFSHLFNVLVGEDIIYLENPIEINEAGWTPLHTCCMSFLTVPAALVLIDEIMRGGADIDTKTVAGPGTFNSEWTCLHMASAYGITQLVEKLIDVGANVNTTNSFGYTPLLEACHRGFQNIVELLVKGGADLQYIPPADKSNSSPFVSAPAQTALSESARCGFHRIVQILLDAGAPKDRGNSLGWTALHEACFYNRTEVVKVLMLSGANASLRTRGGALPYHLAGLHVVRTMLEEMGGAEVVPDASDTIDMVAILRELTMPEMFDGSSSASAPCADTAHQKSITSAGTGIESPSRNSPKKDLLRQFEVEQSSAKKVASIEEKSSSTSKKPAALLHSGGVLGDLPSLAVDKMHIGSAGSSSSSDYARALEYGDSGSDYPVHSTGSPLKNKGRQYADARADGKDKNISSMSSSGTSAGKKIKKMRDVYTPPANFPPSYLCQLSQRPMSDPVKSTYGNVYDRPVILGWMSKQGHICPLSGAPLSESDLKPMDEMAAEIRAWILDNSKAVESRSSGTSSTNGNGNRERDKEGGLRESKVNVGAAAVAADDLYDF